MCYAICAADLDAGLRDSLFAQQTYTRDCIEAIRLYGPLDAENSLKDFCLAHCFDDDDPYWDQNLFEEDGSIGEFIKEIEVPENIFYNVIYDFQEAPATSLRLNCPEGTIPVGAQVYMMNCVSCELFDKFPDQRNNY